jgi:oligoendopeptidase F
MAEPLQQREIDDLSADAERFLAELDEEQYLHFSGQKTTYELAPIYERHEALTQLDTALALGASVDGDRRRRELWKFACEGYLGNFVTEEATRVAELEATLTATVGGEDVPYRMLRPRIMNEDDRGERARLEAARNELTEEHLNSLHLHAAEVVHEQTRRLGAPSYADLYRSFEFRLDDLGAQCRSFLAETESLWEEAGDRLYRSRVGLGLGEIERWDVARALRGAQWDGAFPRETMLPALEATLADLGVDLRAQENVELDLEERPNKDPRAFCAPIDVPGRVVLVIKPQGGPDDWRALFHEAGHTEHFAHTSSSLSMEERRLGDNAVTEGWAMLLEHLTFDPVWLERRLDVGRPYEFSAESATFLLLIVRRYCAKLLYELEFHTADDPTALRPRYVELLADATKVAPSPTDYLADMDGGFYASEYLRAWAFEAQLRAHLRERFGNAWFSRREAGSLLRELWELGQKPTADELLEELAGEKLELAAVGDRVREALAAT